MKKVLAVWSLALALAAGTAAVATVCPHQAIASCGSSNC